MKRGTSWPIAIGVILGATVTANVWLARVASSDPSAVVAKDYYQKGLRWDDEQAQQTHNVALGWQLTPALRLERDATSSDLAVDLKDRDGQPLADARIDVTAVHNAAPGQPVMATLIGQGEGHYGVVLPARRAGMWELRFDVRRGAEHFTADMRVNTERGGG
jgi:nitrogen fixation protein FixH